MVSAMKEDWGRLADHVIAGRVRRGISSRRAFAAHLRAIGHPVTERTLGSLERGERVSMDTVAAVEIGLGWEPGSGRATLRGGQPTTHLTDAAPADATAERHPEIPEWVDLNACEDWEREIWERLLLSSPEDKEAMIATVRSIRRQIEQATQGISGDSDIRRRTI